jgi:hypothetical protein
MTTRTVKYGGQSVEMQYDVGKHDSVSTDVQCFICGKTIGTLEHCFRGPKPGGGELYTHVRCGERYTVATIPEA